MKSHVVELMSGFQEHPGEARSFQETFDALTRNDLGEILKTAGLKTYNCMKLAHYLPIYSELLKPFRGQKIKMLEIGVQHGGSYRLWSNYFGSDLLSWSGLDIEPKCLRLNDGIDASKCEVFLGDQADSEVLKTIARKKGLFDIVIDDGSHCADHVIASFELLSTQIKPGGLYVVEDVHASYWEGFRGTGKYYNIITYFQELLHSLNSQAMSHHRRALNITKQELLASPAPMKKIEFLPSMIVCHMGTPDPLIEWKAGAASIQSN